MYMDININKRLQNGKVEYWRVITLHAVIEIHGRLQEENISSVSCQFSDIGSHSKLSNEQKQCISKQKWCISKQTHSFAQNLPQRKALASREKLHPCLSLLNNIKSCYK